MRYLWSLLTKTIEYKINTLLSPEALKIKKIKKFRKFVRYIEKRSKYYRRIIQENKIDINRCVPEDFPVLTKDDVIENFDEILTVSDINKNIVEQFLNRSKNPAELLNGKYHIIHTSGSSGKIGYYVFHRNDFATSAALSIRIAPAKFRKKMAFVALTDGHYASSTIVFSSHN